MTTTRPPALLRDIDFDSRCIEKVADGLEETIDEAIREWFDSGDIIDTDEPTHLEDEELDAYLDARHAKLRAMILKCMMGA